MAVPNIALIGAGYWGKNILLTLNKLGLIKTVCEKRTDLAEKIKKDYPGLKVMTDIEEVLKDEEIKGVVIATPAKTHYDIAKTILKAGRDVFVEKPIALKAEEAEDLLKMAESQKNILMTDSTFVYHPAIRKMKSLVREGAIGDIYHIHSTRLNLGIVRSEENALWSLAPHDVSLIIDIMGQIPKEAKATGADLLQRGIIDFSSAVFTFKEKKAAASFFVSWFYPQKERKLIITGSKGSIVFDDLGENKLTLYSHNIKNTQGLTKIGVAPVLEKLGEKNIEIPKEEPLENILKDFADCMNTRKNPAADGKSACEVIKVLEACQKSTEKGGQSVLI